MVSKISRKAVLITAAVLAVIGLASWGVWWYFFSGWQLRAVEDEETAYILRVEGPEDTRLVDGKPVPDSVRVFYDMPVARADLIGRRIDKGIGIHPEIKGEWSFTGDSVLTFTPETDWLPGTEYKVSLDSNIFSPEIEVKDTGFSFMSPAFDGRVAEQSFYEDARDSRKKYATADFRFNYPVDPESMSKNIKISSTSGRKYDFESKLYDNGYALHVQTGPLQIAKDEDFITIQVDGLDNAVNKKALPEVLSARVKVPSVETFFKLNSLKVSVVHNEQNDGRPEQILFVGFSTRVSPSELKTKLSLQYSPEPCYKLRKKIQEKQAGTQVGTKALPLMEIPGNDDTAAKTLMFKFDETRREGCLIASVAPGVRSVEGFELTKAYTEFLEIPNYPLEAGIVFDGAVMPLKGSRSVAFVSRGVDQLNVKVARINSKNLNHLVTQTSGDFAHPLFRNYNFTQDNISEVFEEKLSVRVSHPAEPNYASLDLNKYFENNKGVFLLKVQGQSGKNNFSPEDSRLVVITDLGIVVKENLDGSRRIFVSDISKGGPAENALVEVLGKNGLPVLSRQTDSSGMAEIPDLRDFINDKEPVVYKVSLNDDVSFIPVWRADRRLDYSRFDVGGEYDGTSAPDSLKAFMFSDRGIYRPGETAEFGIMIRRKDLSAPANLPFVVEVRNPSGDIVSSRRFVSGALGFSEYEMKLSPTALTGNYSLTLYSEEKDGKRFIASTDFRVREFTPDTLRINAEWHNFKHKGWFSGDELTAAVSLYNLYGNPAAGNRLKASYRLMPSGFSFPEYQGYVFRDPLQNTDKPLRTYDDVLPETQTDTAGNGKLNINFADFERGTYRLSLLVEGLEQGGGRGVGTLLSALVSPNRRLIGWKTDSDLEYVHKNSQHHVDFIAIDNHLRQIDGTDLFLSSYRRKYVSTLVEMPNGTYRYQMVPKNQELFRRPWEIAAAGTPVELDTSAAGDYFLAVENAEGALLAKVPYTVAGNSDMGYGIDKEAGLEIKLDRKEYKAGDEIKMQISAPYKGYGLITIERDRVLAHKWFKAETSSFAEKIRLPENVEGNAYINVALFRDINAREIFQPPLSYGIVPFAVNKDEHRLKINLNTPETVKPGEDLVVRYTTPEASKVIIYGVDEGILQYGGYRLPSPLDRFMPVKALQVSTLQIMDLIMPDIRFLQTLRAPGGDSGYGAETLAGHLNPFARRQNKPVAFWSGVLDASAGENEYVYKVPETFSGEIKVMAVGLSETRFGSTSKAVTVRGDFALIPSGAFNVSPGDEFVIGLSVGNLVKNSENAYPVNVSVDPGAAFEVIGDSSRKLTLAEQGSGLVSFRLRALPKLGAHEIRFSAVVEQDTARRASLPYSLSIRPAAPFRTNVVLGYEKSKLKLKDFAENLYPEYRRQMVTASSSPLVLAQGLIEYLNKFPHACTEQTVSKIFPVMEVFFKYPELVKKIDVYALFDNAMGILRTRQTLSGGFRSWDMPGLPVDRFDSVYAAHFMVEAKKKGFNVPENMLQKALDYARIQAAAAPSGIDDIVPAYAAYVLVLNGDTAGNYLRNLEDYYQKTYPKKWKQSLAASFMASSYALLQDKTKAGKLSGRFEAEKVPPEFVAMDIYLRAAHFAENFSGLDKKETELLLRPLTEGRYNTVISAYSVLALNAAGRSENDKNISFSAKPVEYTPFPGVSFLPSTRELTVSSPEPFYYAVSQEGYSAAETISPLSDGLEIYQEITDKDNNIVSAAKTGDELTVKIRYRSKNGEYVNDVALVSMLPGCFEVVSENIDDAAAVDSADIREDRVVVYTTAAPDYRELSYRVKVVAEGNFVVPPLYAEALYNPLLRANTAGGAFNAAK